MSNRLATQKSPYLLQHADNPVDWYPYGSEAFDRAQREGRPVLISIGYSSCHWCHVMAHESFEDEATAAYMNEHLVNIKVDREERPDVDSIYMEAVQGLTGQGGWPLNVFVTPDGRPFFGGTYFPPEPHHGLPSWRQVLEGITTAYREQHGEVLKNAGLLTEYLERAQRLPQSPELPTFDLLASAYSAVVAQFDRRHGGFGGAPKFPQPLGLEFVLRMDGRLPQGGREFVHLTLHAMAEGGIYDHLAGGFHRYSVDSRWLVPHFEKMLYDNALLARVYLLAYQSTHADIYRRVTQETLGYLARDMCSPEGAFYSAEDADSEGVEGKYYVWTPDDLERTLAPEEARIAALAYGVRPGGNFEGATILTTAMPVGEVADRLGVPVLAVAEGLSRAREGLLRARSQRVPPGKDTKILVGWNALAIRAFAEAGAALGRPEYIGVARRAVDFILDAMRPNGRLVRSYQDGPSSVPGFLEDYAFLAEALITVYETTGETSYLEQARGLVEEMTALFWDDDLETFFDSPIDLSELVVRPRSLFDNPIPSGNSAATFALLRLEALTGITEHADRALPALRTVQDLVARAPLGFAYMLSALDFYLSTPLQIAVVGDPATASDDLTRVIFERYLPNKVVAVGEGSEVALLAGRERLGGKRTAYVCRHFACQLPVTDPVALAEQLDAAEA